MDCTHHWLIAEADGPTSPGKCKHCGEEREFKNVSDSTLGWRGNPTLPEVVTMNRFREAKYAEDSEYD